MLLSIGTLYLVQVPGIAMETLVNVLKPHQLMLSEQIGEVPNVNAINLLVTCKMVQAYVLSPDAVEAHSCVDIVAKFTDEQYTTINQSTAGCFNPRVFVNCLQVYL